MRSLVFLLLVCGALADSRLTTKGAKITTNKAITFPKHIVQYNTVDNRRSQLFDVLFTDEFSIRGTEGLVGGFRTKSRAPSQVARSHSSDLLTAVLIAQIILVSMLSQAGGNNTNNIHVNIHHNHNVAVSGTLITGGPLITSTPGPLNTSNSSLRGASKPAGPYQDLEENPFSEIKVPSSAINEVNPFSDTKTPDKNGKVPNVNSLNELNSISDHKVPASSINEVNSLFNRKLPDVRYQTKSKRPINRLFVNSFSYDKVPVSPSTNDPELFATLARTILPSLLPLLTPKGHEQINYNLIMDKIDATAFARIDGVQGELYFAQIKPTQYERESATVIAGALKGFKALTNYKISLHQSGDTTDDCSNVGRLHAGIKEHQFKTDTEGRCVLLLHESGLRIRGKDGIMGGSVVITDPEGAQARNCGIVINT